MSKFEEVEICCECGGITQQLHVGDEGWTFCPDCEAVEGKTETRYICLDCQSLNEEEKCDCNITQFDKTIMLVRGLPGSGKSTFVSQFLKEFEHFEADDFWMKEGKYNFDITRLGEAHKWCQMEVENVMKLGEPKVAVSNTFTTEREMQPYFDLAKLYGYKVVTIVVENRHGSKDIHSVPDETLKKMADRFNLKLI